MDLSELGNSIYIIAAVLLLLVFNVFLRTRRKEQTPSEICLSLLADVNVNQNLAEDFQYNLRVKKFATGSWQRNRNKIDFLDAALQSTLGNVFSMAENFNQDIDSARKYKSVSYLSGIDVYRLKEYLAKGKQGLEEWFQTKANQQPLPGRRGGLLG